MTLDHSLRAQNSPPSRNRIFSIFSVFHFLLGLEQDFRPKILLKDEILLEEQDFKPEFVDQNQEFREILFLLDGNLCA
jgi:hypothetical protein